MLFNRMSDQSSVHYSMLIVFEDIINLCKPLAERLLILLLKADEFNFCRPTARNGRMSHGR
jgi:hypothetical protein